MRMSMTVTASLPAAIDAARDRIAASVTHAMDVVVLDAQGKLRAEADRNFTKRGRRTQSVAKAVRGKSYPEGTRTSLGPAGVVAIPWRLAAAFTQGVTIAGQPWLAIPTEEGLRAGGAGSYRKGERNADVAAVIERFGRDNIHLIRSGRNFVLAADVAEFAGDRRFHKRRGSYVDRRGVKQKRTLVVLFTLVRRVTLAPRLSLQRVADEGAAQLVTEIKKLGS